MTVVAMTSRHVDLLMPYEHELFGNDSWTAQGYRAEIADKDSRYYIAVEDEAGELLGWAGLMVVADAAEILTVGVVPAAQRRGLARLMLAALYDETRRRGARELFLEVRVDNAAAITLYDSEGFEQVGRRRGYYDHGRVDAVVMRRVL